MASVRRSARIAAQPRTVSANSLTSSARLDRRRGARKFTLFPKLPAELQLMIWSHACDDQQSEKRFLRVAPDFISIPLDNAQVPIRIYYEGSGSPCIVPSMMQACRSSRSLASKNYTLLPCVDIVTGLEVNNSIYVNVNEDIFFFGDKHPKHFTAFDFLMYCIKFKKIDYQNRLGFFKSIKNLALDWESYQTIMESDCRWLLHVNPQKITILVRNPTRETIGLRPSYAHKARSIKSRTYREDLAHCILKWTDLYVEHLIEKDDPTYNPPSFEVADLSKEDAEENSLEDMLVLDLLLN